MALSYIRFTELDAVSSVDTNAILPVVETVTNINKKITVGNLNNSLPLGVDVSILKATSGNWNSNYSTTNSNSANWSSVYNSVNPVSANWNSVYTTTQNNSAGWESVEASVFTTSANWNSTYTSVSQTSASWNSVYTNINTTSAQYTQSFVGATATTNGVGGVVPRPLSGQQVSYLKGDATWGTPGTFQIDTSTNTLPLSNNTGRTSWFNNNRWYYPIVNGFGLYGQSWDYRMYFFQQLIFFRPVILTQLAFWVTSVLVASPNEYMRIVVASNNPTRNTPGLTLREIVTPPGILNSTGPKVIDLPTPLQVEPGAIWVGAIMSSGYTNVAANQIAGGGYSSNLGLLAGLMGALVGATFPFISYPADEVYPYIATNYFTRTYNASNSAPTDWDAERALYDSSIGSYWWKLANQGQLWVAR
ncbi:MAG: hypothetical protein EBX50_13565 [Chitinophagia bacterium]|nr:hypothetical protein [Chitinophagia bacterium]